MSTAEPVHPQRRPTVFLSYASEDRPAAQALRDALPAQGLEVWYDESGLAGGDAWDQKIRLQIRECDYFMPLISAQTEARHEGYFRREWRLAVERTLDMADDHPFLLPIVIDETQQYRARVPERFLTVQWTRVPGGQANAALAALCRRLLAVPEPVIPDSAPRTHPPLGAEPPPAASRATALPREFPPFPREEQGQRTRFRLEVLFWGLQSAAIIFRRLPRLVQLFICIWLFIVGLQQCDHSEDKHSPKISAEDVRKLSQIAQSYQGSSNHPDYAKLGTEIATQFAGAASAESSDGPRLLAIPFEAASADSASRPLVDATFAQVYGRIALSQHGRVGLIEEALADPEPATVAELGRKHHSQYVLYGEVEGDSEQARLTVHVVRAKDGSQVWSGSYPTAGADAAAIGTAIDSAVHDLEDDD